jgi:hypothetical protein
MFLSYFKNRPVAGVFLLEDNEANAYYVGSGVNVIDEIKQYFSKSTSLEYITNIRVQTFPHTVQAYKNELIRISNPIRNLIEQEKLMALQASTNLTKLDLLKLTVKSHLSISTTTTTITSPSSQIIDFQMITLALFCYVHIVFCYVFSRIAYFCSVYIYDYLCFLLYLQY